jgi:peptidoglycan-associated lipoprotein
MRIRRFGNAMLYGLLGLMVVGAGCSHKVAVKPPEAPPAANPPARPSVTLDASRTNIDQGQSVNLRWSATNATSVSVTPELGNVAAQGTSTVSPSQSTTYTATAIGPGGSATTSTHVTVTVAAAAAPAPAGPTIEEMFTREVQDAFFDYDKVDIRADARQALSKTADFLRSYPQVAIVIEGHCDERGSTEYNLALGDRRSDSAKDFLVALGVAADRIQTVSYGKERPFCTVSNEGCWQQNRRAHVRMVGTSSSRLSGN